MKFHVSFLLLVFSISGCGFTIVNTETLDSCEEYTEQYFNLKRKLQECNEKIELVKSATDGSYSEMREALEYLDECREDD
jgi:hypothetical protein